MSIYAAASQSTVSVTMGADQGGGDCTAASITGNIFGLAISAINSGAGFGGVAVDAAGSASGQAFFRQLKIGATTQTSASSSYNSGANTWTFGSLSLSPSTSYTLQFLR